MVLDGQLRDKEDKPFKFDVYSDRRKNQDRYERLGEVMLHVSFSSFSCVFKAFSKYMYNVQMTLTMTFWPHTVVSTAFAVTLSVRQSVSRSICHTHESYLNALLHMTE